MTGEIENFRLQKAVERGFVQAGETDQVQVQIGLETMHEAPLESVGQFAVEQVTTVEV